MMKDVTEWATIGTIVAPFGLQGELKIYPLTDVPDRFTSLPAVYVGPDHIRYRLNGVRPYKGELLILKLKGVNDATAAEALRSQQLFIPLKDLATLPPDSYYQHDIIGLQVRKMDDSEVGTIVDIIVTGGNDVYVVRMGNGKQALIPAIKEVIKQIDLIRKVMYIDPMQGLLDDGNEEKDVSPEEENM
jgi:16S rRNA processing protein RimM